VEHAETFRFAPLTHVSVRIRSSQNQRKPAFRHTSFSVRLDLDQENRRAFQAAEALGARLWHANPMQPHPNIAKVSGLLVIAAGTASLCTAHVMYSKTAADPWVTSNQSDIPRTARNVTPAALVLAPAGWRAYLASAGLLARPEAPVVVTIAKRNEPRRKASSVHPTSPTTPMSAAALARELQRELRRVGCYDGELNGRWTHTTRTSMKTFTNRVNAILPLDEPDPILLAMVQGYADRVCGVACPAKEQLADDGRCVPSMILARSAKTVRRGAIVPATVHPHGIVTLVRSTVTPTEPGLAGVAHGPMLATGSAAQHVNAGAAAARPARAARVRVAARQRTSPRQGGFGATFFRQADAFGPH